VLADVFGADIDLDPVAEDDYEFEALPLDGDCDSACLAGTHDGVVNLTPDACSYILSRPDSATGPNPPEKQPEFIDIRIDALDENEACTVLVFVKTVPNAAHRSTDKRSLRSHAVISSSTSGIAASVP
jgi:hypothetical protein